MRDSWGRPLACAGSLAPLGLSAPSPCPPRYSTTASARFTESFWLYSGVPVPSV